MRNKSLEIAIEIIHYLINIAFWGFLVYLLYFSFKDIGEKVPERRRENHLCEWKLIEKSWVDNFYIYTIQCKHGNQEWGNGSSLPEFTEIEIGESVKATFVIVK